jgi:CubicO group peptidase (beta-lactamase class C family)
MTELVDKIFMKEIKADSPGAAVAIVKDHSIIYKNGYGLACMDYDIPITPSTIFHVASVSKQFTAFSVAMIADQGEISLNDDIRKYLHEVPDFGKTITIRHLIHHTSGLRDQWELLMLAGWLIDDVITQEHILKLVSNQRELNFTPGDKYLYCNTGYTLLAEIVSRVSGKSFVDYTSENIFKPLCMNNTHFHDDYEMIVKNMAYSYYYDNNGILKKSILTFANVGATSLFTTVEDLAKWMDNYDKKSVGGESVINQMMQKGKLNNGEEINYAFALKIAEYRGLKTFGHDGMDAGYRTCFVCFPEQKFGIIILCNLGSLSPYNLAMQIADIYLADQLTPIEIKNNIEAQKTEEVKSDEPIIDFNEYLGDYYSDELGTVYTMIFKDNHLTIRHRRLSDKKLDYVEKDVFKGNSITKLAFTRDDKQKINGFKLNGSGRVFGLQFQKIGNV